MKVLIVCGVFSKEHQKEVLQNARRFVEFSANLFQQKLIAGFRQTECQVNVLSAPFIGAFPMASSIAHFRSFSTATEEYTYVSFNNIWGVRNVSRGRSLKKAIETFAQDPDDKKFILIYCPHTPFLQATVHAKKLDPRIRCCLYVPDLPEYMNLAEKRTLVYEIAKKYDIAVMTKLMEQMDGFVLLTEQMKNLLPVGNKPYMVSEGIIDVIPSVESDTLSTTGEKNVVYTGKLNARFGVRDLIDGFAYLQNPKYRLILCGSGDCDDYAAAAAKKDSRILPLGQVLPKEAAAWQSKATVLVNPRKGGESYTRYSFPSKNLEYLLSGKPVVAHRLEGMPEIYSDFLYEIKDSQDHPRALADAILAAASDSAEGRMEKYKRFLHYAKENLLAVKVAEAVIELMDGDKG